MTALVQSRSIEQRLRVQMTAAFEDKLRAWRKKNPDVAYDGDRLVDFMFDLVNSNRARVFQKPDADRREVFSAETCASGHVDYEHKFALYCVEVVLG